MQTIRSTRSSKTRIKIPSAFKIMNSICIIHIPQSGSAAIPGFLLLQFPDKFPMRSPPQAQKLPRATRQVRQSSDSFSARPAAKADPPELHQIVLLIGRQCEEPDSRNCFLFSIRRIHFSVSFCSIPDVQIFIPVYHIFLSLWLNLP